jgi:hypothetical protein
LETAIRGTPVVESHHARVFCAGNPEPYSGTTFNSLEIMKPTPQISDTQNASRSFPLSDYNFQPTIDAKSTSSPVVPTIKSPAFHKLSSEFLGAEANRNYVVEILLFLLITGIAAWPIISSIVAVIRMVRNY